jgi:hypothetical protein
MSDQKQADPVTSTLTVLRWTMVVIFWAFTFLLWYRCLGWTVESVDNISCVEEVIDANSRNRTQFECDNNAHAVHDGNGKYRCVCGK